MESQAAKTCRQGHRLLPAALALLAFTSQASAAVCRYDNLMPAFLAFEQKTKDLSPDQRATLFASDFAPRYKGFYGAMGRVEGVKEYPSAEELRKDALRLLDPAHMETLPGFPPLTQAKFEAAAQAVGPDFDKVQAAFSRSFPHFRCPAEIAFGPSFTHFDGHVYDDENGQHILFGVDALAILHHPDEMPAVYAHELFHIYHREALGKAYPNADGIVWWEMWREGLATYVSQRLNPSLSAQQVLTFPSDLVARMDTPSAKQRAARLMLADLDTKNTAWFDTMNAISDLPPRTGYYMGYQFAASLGREHSLDWLAHLPPARVKREERAFLMAISR